MRDQTRAIGTVVVAAALATAVAAAATGCGNRGGDGEGAPSPPTTAPAGGTAVDDTITTGPDATVVAVEVTDGSVTGGAGRERIALGESVRLEVTSDVADRVHVHGYDLFEDVGARETAVIEFTADIPGVFEVELEDRHLLLVELQVQ